VGITRSFRPSLEAGADVNAKDKEGKTALMHAAGGQADRELITLLLDSGADVSAKYNEGETALRATLFPRTPPAKS
jgi:ankyrin repeat/SOCS box protein 6